MSFLSALPMLGGGAATTGAATTGMMGGFPWLSAVTMGGQILSGISGRLTAAARARAEADALQAQGRRAEQIQIMRDKEIIAKGRAVAGASGLVPSSGTPLSVTIDNITNMERNAIQARYTGRLQASERTAEAARYARPWGMLGDAATALTTPSGSILTQWLSQRMSP